jgi:N-acetyl-gamma-glutamyl-phosphate reductase
MSIRAGIVGFRGYSGMELQAILSRHPNAEPWLLEHRQDAAEAPQPRGVNGPPRLAAKAEAARAEGLSVVFLATPADVSMELAPSFLEAGLRVIDLSGAFRLRTVENYQRWYGEPHTQPALLQSAVYGLPEFYRDAVRGARLVSNPGCYPTAANLALRPLMAAGLADRTSNIVCDAKSGVSGAGRKPSLKTHFCEVTENFSAYSLLNHRHVPEVLLNSLINEHEFNFVAQLIPVHRGILETIYLRTVPGTTAESVLYAYESAYSSEPFVRLYNPGQVPDLQSVNHTNLCGIGFTLDAPTSRLVVVAAIDNLGKGAAGQAVQNMNLMFGLGETEALL